MKEYRLAFVSDRDSELVVTVRSEPDADGDVVKITPPNYESWHLNRDEAALLAQLLDLTSE
jgi:hypothetical protein